MRRLTCLVFGCDYDHKEDCKRCGRERPALTRAIERAGGDGE